MRPGAPSQDSPDTERTHWEKWIFFLFFKDAPRATCTTTSKCNANARGRGSSFSFSLSRDTPSPRMSELNSYARGSHTRTTQTQQQQQSSRSADKENGSMLARATLALLLFGGTGTKKCISAGRRAAARYHGKPPKTAGTQGGFKHSDCAGMGIWSLFWVPRASFIRIGLDARARVRAFASRNAIIGWICLLFVSFMLSVFSGLLIPCVHWAFAVV